MVMPDQHAAAAAPTPSQNYATGGGAPADRSLIPRWLDVFFRGLLATGAMAVIGLFAWLTIYHINDRYALWITDGVWIGLAERTVSGTFYPPIFDGETYGGTRYMPLPLLLHAGLARLTGDLLMGGKLASALGMAAAAISLLALLRTVGAGWSLAMGMVAAFLATPATMLVGHAIRADAWPLALQLLAITVMVRASEASPRPGTKSARPGRGDLMPSGRTERAKARTPSAQDREARAPENLAAALAGVLCAAAFLFKFTSVWAPGAIGLWLLFRNWRALGALCIAWAAVVAAGILGFNWLSDGRMFENLFSLGAAGFGSHAMRWVYFPYHFIAFVTQCGHAVWALVPLALLAIIARARWRRLGLVDVAWLCCFALIVVMFTDLGVSMNHLVDPMALTLAVLAALWGAPGAAVPAQPALRQIITITALWAGGTQAVVLLVPDSFRALTHALDGTRDPRHTTLPLAGEIGPEARVLFSDPSLALSCGRRPEIIDSFMLHGIARVQPDLVAPLIRRIESREYDKIVTWFDVGQNLRKPLFFDLGPALERAIDENYTPARRVNNIWIYERREEVPKE